MKAIYPAIFMPEDTGEYSVVFPDLEGCNTYGDNLEHAITMAQEALGLYLVSLEERRISIPIASDVRMVVLDNADSFAVPVMIEVNDYRRNKSVNKMLTLPAWLNDAGERAHVNFSGVLQEALKQKLGY